MSEAMKPSWPPPAGKKSYEPIPKLRPAPKAPKGGRARPDEPLADWCSVRIPNVCTGRAECRHHRLRRSQGGDDSAANTTDCCDKCHAWIHANPAWSFSRGWLKRRKAS